MLSSDIIDQIHETQLDNFCTLPKVVESMNPQRLRLRNVNIKFDFDKNSVKLTLTPKVQALMWGSTYGGATDKLAISVNVSGVSE